MPLSRDEQEALDELLPRERQTGDLTEDLAAAARVAMERRRRNTEWGGAVIEALHRETQSWTRVEQMTGIPGGTARRWASPPQ